MSKKRIAQYCCAALVAAGVGLNIQNAIADYGIAENSLSLVAVGGSNSGSNSNSNSNSNCTGGKSGYNRYQIEGGFFDHKETFWYCIAHEERIGYNPKDVCHDDY